MIYARDLPILTLVDDGVRRQGMLSAKAEWCGVQARLTTDFLDTPEFTRTFQSWVELVRERKPPEESMPPAEPAELSAMGHILKGLGKMSMAEAIAAAVAVFGGLSALATASFNIGQKLSPDAKPAVSASSPAAASTAPLPRALPRRPAP